MAKNLRTFIAIKIEPEPELLDFIEECKEVFEGEAIKWVEEDNLHLTLKFLGDTTEDKVDRIKNILKETCLKFTGFSFHINGTGYYKTRGYPNVLYVGISDFMQMQTIAVELNVRLFDLGFEKETKVFKPHLTLGRIKYLKDKKRFYEFIDKYKNKSIQKVLVSKIIFYQSILKSQGPEYIPLHITQLNIQR